MGRVHAAGGAYQNEAASAAEAGTARPTFLLPAGRRASHAGHEQSTALDVDAEKLEAQKKLVIRQLRVCFCVCAARMAVDSVHPTAAVQLLDDERKSPFNNFPKLNDRYLLLRLLGKGGFR